MPFPRRIYQRSVHNVLNFPPGERLSVVDIEAGHVRSPAPDCPVKAALLHIHPAGDQHCAGRHNLFFILPLPLFQQILGISGFLNLFPRLCQPGIDEVHQLRLILAADLKLPCNISKPYKRRSKHIHAESNTLPPAAFDLLPKSLLVHPVMLGI